LPPDLSSGTYRILDISDSAAGGLYEGKLILDKTYGHAAYGCAICCGYNVAFMYYDPLDVLISTQGSQLVQAGNSCSGTTQTITGDFPTWGTANSAIATASKAVVAGVGLGTTTVDATSVPMYWGLKEYSPTCPTMQKAVSSPVNVGNAVTLVGTDCNTQPNASWSASWGNAKNLLACSLSAPGPTLPPGGSCVTNGTANGEPRNCYQVNTSTCSITYCPGSTRLVNSACTMFLDLFPVVTVTAPAGCTQ
jgi:hypothetical protein